MRTLLTILAVICTLQINAQIHRDTFDVVVVYDTGTKYPDMDTIYNAKEVRVVERNYLDLYAVEYNLIYREIYFEIHGSKVILNPNRIVELKLKKEWFREED